MKIMAAWGTGLKRIRNACREFELPEPLIEEEGYGFHVTFYRKTSNSSLNENDVRNAETEIDTDLEKTSTGSEKIIIGSDETSDHLEMTGSVKKERGYAAIKDFETYRNAMLAVETEKRYIEDTERFYLKLNTEVFKQSDIMSLLDCSKTKALHIMQAMRQAAIIIKVEGHGFGAYRFC